MLFAFSNDIGKNAGDIKTLQIAKEWFGYNKRRNTRKILHVFVAVLERAKEAGESAATSLTRAVQLGFSTWHASTPRCRIASSAALPPRHSVIYCDGKYEKWEATPGHASRPSANEIKIHRARPRTKSETSGRRYGRRRIKIIISTRSCLNIFTMHVHVWCGRFGLCGSTFFFISFFFVSTLFKSKIQIQLIELGWKIK